MVRSAIIAFGVSLLAMINLPRQSQAFEDKTISVESIDPEMNRAIEKARGSLSAFWTHYSNPGPGEKGFALKVRLDEGSKHEHFWLVALERRGDQIFGKIDNDPNLIHNYKYGQVIQVELDRISDWMYFRDGKIVGNETLRPLLKRMPKAQADQFRARLETP
jgi:uncharacterized protein YegJ (DUF2314 family)